MKQSIEQKIKHLQKEVAELKKELNKKQDKKFVVRIRYDDLLNPPIFPK